MKIIKKDNYDRETVSDFLVAENVNEFFAPKIAHLLNEATGKDGPDFFKAVPDDYQLYTFEP